MRILTIRQPWAWAIIHGGKDVENRVRNIAGDYRGPVAIHVSKRLPPFQEHWDSATVVAGITGYRPLFHDPRSMGAIVGVVELADVHEAETVSAATYLQPDLVENTCCASPWGENAGVWHLCLANPRALAEPIPYRGALGLRTLDEATAAAVLEAIA